MNFSLEQLGQLEKLELPSKSASKASPWDRWCSSTSVHYLYDWSL